MLLTYINEYRGLNEILIVQDDTLKLDVSMHNSALQRYLVYSEKKVNRELTRWGPMNSTLILRKHLLKT